MLYNGMDFVGTPIDVLARVFRNKSDKEFSTIQEACECFLKFLTNFKRTVNDEEEHLEAVLQREAREISREYENENTDALLKAYREKEKDEQIDVDSVYRSVIIDVFSRHADAHKQQRLPDFLERVSTDEFSERFGELVKRVMKRSLSRWADDPVVYLESIKWAYECLRSSIFSDIHTGLVFGGFGTDDIFPSLHAIEIDGIYFGEIKKRQRIVVDIDRRGERAAVVPFAQSEMVERFLFGIDDELEQKILSFVEQSFDKLCERYDRQHSVDLASLGLSGESYSESVSGILERLKERSRRETLDMVDFMPKQELAYTAEAFVTLTSMKRKVSAQQETVGGPIDVAVITKNEGFVWIKRKHYFDRELNVGYGIRAIKIREGGLVNDKPRSADSRNRKPKKDAATSGAEKEQTSPQPRDE